MPEIIKPEPKMEPMTEQQRLREAQQYEEKTKNVPTTKTKMPEGKLKFATGGSVGSASKRADGIAQRGKTRGKVC
jgi:hypothetical protein